MAHYWILRVKMSICSCFLSHMLFNMEYILFPSFSCMIYFSIIFGVVILPFNFNSLLMSENQNAHNVKGTDCDPSSKCITNIFTKEYIHWLVTLFRICYLIWYPEKVSEFPGFCFDSLTNVFLGSAIQSKKQCLSYCFPGRLSFLFTTDKHQQIVPKISVWPVNRHCIL